MSKTFLNWTEVLSDIKSSQHFAQLMQTIEKQREQGTLIYPPHDQLFRALALTDFSKVSVVILGQDPYHGPNQANGLAFSVNKGIATPPSLRNMYKELQADLGIEKPEHGDLTSWAKQGVLLINAVLSVEDGKPNSHKDYGWSTITDAIIASLNHASQPIAFLLWGGFAQKKAPLITQSHHKIFTAPHPSPLSAHRGFFGCKHFSQVNLWLEKQNRPVIDWKP